ncbi:MAG TPA: hypothetical protein VKZ95_00175, partial [Sphingobacteriaceae bacterium]|nr:hypothetical protein [Sphingobacteriaceae bacterium]
MIGKKFGKLTVIEKAKKEGRTLYLCVCDCGNERYLPSYSLTSGNNKSCGCIRFKKAGLEEFMTVYRISGTLREAEIKTGYPKALAYRYNKEEVSAIARIR